VEIDKKVVEYHIQKDRYSCIPSAVELVLKLLKKVPLNYYELQDIWSNKQNGSFADFDGKTIENVTFTRRYNLTLKKLLEVVDEELKSNRFVIIPLPLGSEAHCYVIYGKDNDDYLAVAKLWRNPYPAFINNVKKRIGPIDILTYKVV